MVRPSSRSLLAIALAFVALPVRAQLPSNSVPAVLADERVLIGHYRYVERSDGMKIDVYLKADHSALYRIGSGANDADFMKAEGFWTYDGDTVHIHNRPGPVRLVQSSPPVRDPKAGLSVVVVEADGRDASGVGVTWAGAQGLFSMNGGRHSWSSSDLGSAKLFYVLRISDRKVLQEVALKPGGPNSFRFTYHPSEVEPFDIPAIALDDRAQQLEVEVGTSFARLTRVK